MNKLFIIHYYPIDYFPPVMNLIETLEKKIDITVSSTQRSNSLVEFKGIRVKIFRKIKENKSDNSVKILIKYFIFTLFTLGLLIRKRPNAILYYESISAFPAYLYKYFFNRKVKLCIHYHEYMTPEEYKKNGMRLSRFNLKLEKSWLLQNAIWISQTNEYRKAFFLKDNPNISKSICHLLPNYPPQNWLCTHKNHVGDIVKCVYIGSLSLKDTFVLDFCRWVNLQGGKVQFDIYSFNFHQDTFDAIEALHSPFIKFYKEGVKYMEIPHILKFYDVGVLLYRAQTLNFKFNETNKFYEYLICGLDVWYPKEMTLLHEMDKSLFAPDIKEMDINNGLFPKLDFSSRLVNNSSYNMFSEKVYESFLQLINNNF